MLNHINLQYYGNMIKSAVERVLRVGKVILFFRMSYINFACLQVVRPNLQKIAYPLQVGHSHVQVRLWLLVPWNRGRRGIYQNFTNFWNFELYLCSVLPLYFVKQFGKQL